MSRARGQSLAHEAEGGGVARQSVGLKLGGYAGAAGRRDVGESLDMSLDIPTTAANT